MTPVDRHFAENLRVLRTSRKLSQTQIAERMAELGFSFYQVTVSRIEEGQRPVRLGEAYALAHVLGTRLSALVGPELPPCCQTCFGAPPAGFTCNTCGLGKTS